MERFNRILYKNLSKMEQVETAITIIVLSGNLWNMMSTQPGRIDWGLCLRGHSLSLGNSGYRSLSCPLPRTGDIVPSSSLHQDASH